MIIAKPPIIRRMINIERLNELNWAQIAAGLTPLLQPSAKFCIVLNT